MVEKSQSFGSEKDRSALMIFMPTITGRVVDQFTGRGIPASVSAGGSVTNAGADGRFSVFVNPGTYTVTAYYVGYSPAYRTVSASIQENTDIGDLGLSPVFQAL